MQRQLPIELIESLLGLLTGVSHGEPLPIRPGAVCQLPDNFAAHEAALVNGRHASPRAFLAHLREHLSI